MPILSCGGDNQSFTVLLALEVDRVKLPPKLIFNGVRHSCAAKNADRGTHKELAGRRSLSCSFVYLKGSNILLGIRNFVSKMSVRIKFQKHVPFNCILLIKLDVVYFVYCKEY